MYTDTEMLDWLSKQNHVDWRRTYDSHPLDFFSIPSQYIKATTLREAISRAMQIQLKEILLGNEKMMEIGLEPLHFPPQTYK